jgi:succinoglycan biosynthesis transport protein ExoP
VQRQQAQLSEKLGDQHPDIIKLRSTVQVAQAKLEAEIAKVVQSIRNDYQAAKAQEDSLAAALESQKQEALALNRKEIGYAALQREAESNRQIYNNLLQRAKETGVSEELKTSNVRIIDSAQVPRSPVQPNKPRDAMLAILTGLGAGILVAFGFEYFDNRIKSPYEVKTHLGLPCFGMLPAVLKKYAPAGDLLINNGVPPTFAEAFRAVRTNVLYSSPEAGAKSLLITSTGTGEGKTVVASNLAISLAQTGQRVVLIDADMRRPRLHHVFDVGQEPGLSNLIVGNAKAAEAIVKTGVPQLWMVAAGHLPPNPADLLESKRFKDFIEGLSEQFDWIVIDSPPVMPVTDPAIIARIAHEVLFVIGAEMVSRQAAQHAIDQLEGPRSRLVGAVLNKANLEGNSYYYSAYYNRQYRDYYVQPNPV